MLYLFPAYVAWNYYLFVTVVALATIQAAAAQSRLRGLLLGGRLISPGVSLRVLGLVSIAAASLFVWLSPDLLSPGLAGSELMLVFGGGVLTAVVASLIGGLCCRSDGGAYEDVDSVPEYALPVAGYTYRLWKGANHDGRFVIILTDPDLPESAMLPLCQAVSTAGLTCYLVGWGGEGVPRYPDALAAIPMCIAVHGGEHPRALVVGSGAGGDLALRAAADDERIEQVLAVGPALEVGCLVTGLALLAEMHILDAWRWYRAWDRRSFVEALEARDALTRLGGRARLLMSTDDGFFHPPGWLEAEADRSTVVRVLRGFPHRSLVEGAAVNWLAEILAGQEEVDDVRPG